MNNLLLETYSDFLIFNQGQAASTTFSEATNKTISHDKFTRFLNKEEYSSEDFWKKASPLINNTKEGILSIDDFIVEKPHSKVSDINCYHYSHLQGRCLKGMEVINMVYSGGDLNIPVNYQVISKPVEYCDLKTKKVRKKSLKTKNERARELIKWSVDKCLNVSHITADSWFCCGETLEFIHQKNKKYVFAIKSNRKVFLTLKDREKKIGCSLKLAELEDNTPTPFFINNVNHKVYIMKKTFKNGDGKLGVLFLVTNDKELSNVDLYSIYQKRWGIEVFHKSVKNNTSLAKSPVSSQKAQRNHIFCSYFAYLKLERTKEKEGKNQFRMKRDIQILMLKSCREHYENSFHLAA